jgi:5'-3' exonuclease
MSKKNITIVDLDSIIYISAYNLRNDLNVNPRTIRKCNRIVDNFMSSILKETDAHEYLGYYAKIGGKPCFRYDVATTDPKKENRKKKPPEDWFVMFRPIIHERLVKEWKCEGIESFEADDYVAQSASKFRDSGNYNVTVAGVDKDLLQIHGVIHYNFNTKEKKRLSVLASQQCLYKLMLEGDVSDNYKGLPGVGKEKAKEILGKATNEYGLFRSTVVAYIKYFKEGAIQKVIDKHKKQIYAKWKLNNEGQRLLKSIKIELDKDLNNLLDEFHILDNFKNSTLYKDKFKESYTIAKLPSTGDHHSGISIIDPIVNENKLYVQDVQSMRDIINDII